MKKKKLLEIMEAVIQPRAKHRTRICSTKKLWPGAPSTEPERTTHNLKFWWNLPQGVYTWLKVIVLSFASTFFSFMNKSSFLMADSPCAL